MDEIEPTHVAYADESYYSKERFRSISVLTFEKKNKSSISNAFRVLIEDSNVKEFKWSKLRQARERFAATKIIDKAFELAANRQLRIDTLIWDTHDTRHSILGRDDIANLQRMYYHLFKNVMERRWGKLSSWELYPDENTALNWISVHDYLNIAGLTMEVDHQMLENKPFKIRLTRDFQINKIEEVSSIKEPLSQVTDLFAGIGAYSHSAYHKYSHWLEIENGQLMLDFGLLNEANKITNSEKDRFRIIKHLDEQGKKNRLGISLNTGKGLKTFDPKSPINFWVYTPQHSNDKAPKRK